MNRLYKDAIGNTNFYVETLYAKHRVSLYYLESKIGSCRDRLKPLKNDLVSLQLLERDWNFFGLGLV
ncbi:hypothetical protein Ga0466249_005122 [Sporomusaceae bacterium BoRhaA]|uniref:hypothetical protein n=1 Tax=Pelorhabdus rhamnosifermentans TaxID=2772457 RepID=UPI001C0626AC|nr:hypothetical protein [Pelorhabdus rhamnosifermentans]MBU2703970.1 hypothetical protein [Pelorhabdus rhamnosifermentans]